MNGEKGILRYRGIPIEQLAEHSTFVETAYLLINGELPTLSQRKAFSEMLNTHSLVHEDMRAFFEKFPRGAHPMGILSSMVNALRAFLPGTPGADGRGRDQYHRGAASLKAPHAGRHVASDIPRPSGDLSVT
jgi:citrate synthase